MLNRATLAALAAAAMTAGVLAGAACDGGGGGVSDTEVAAAISAIDSAGLHEIDESISQDREIPATAHTTALHVQAIVALAHWPDGLEDDAERLERSLREFAAAIDTDNPDMTRAGELANQMHDAWHDFSRLVWEYLLKRAGIGGGSEGHE